MEQKYTTTLFILAQVHSKLENIDQGIRYCGLTMKRQLAANEYQLKDWVVNAITLSEAFQSRSHFAQAEYLLYAAYHVMPQECKTEDEVGLKATVQM